MLVILDNLGWHSGVTMLSGSKAYVYAPGLAEQDCGFVFSHAKQLAFSYKFPEKSVGGWLLNTDINAV
jgi:hypothetical protein